MEKREKAAGERGAGRAPPSKGRLQR